MSLICDSPANLSFHLTAMRYLQAVNQHIRGSGKAIVVTVDMGLYRPMKELQMTLSETNLILILGDLQKIMVMLRCIGGYIEMAGIPELLIESGVYGETTVKQLLEGKPLQRSFRAHVTTIHAFHELLFEQISTASFVVSTVAFIDV